MSKGVMLLQDRESKPWLPEEVQQFAWDMARKLKCNEHKGGWDELTVGEPKGSCARHIWRWLHANSFDP